MSMHKNISIVIATHNGSRFIQEQLNSIVNQTLLPLEIIISDDASTDDTLNIVQSFLSSYDIHFRIIRNIPALGFRTNFLKAASNARGDFIAFCDQDDIWDVRKLEVCSRHMNDQSVSLITHTAISVDCHNRKLGMFSQGIQNSGLMPPLSYDPWQTFFGFSMIFRRELLDLWSFEDRFIDFIVPSEMISHDRWVMFLAQMVGNTFEINIPLVRYRQHANNLFGDGILKRNTVSRAAAGASYPYRTATNSMITIIENLPESTVQQFPLFNRARALGFLKRALRQLEERELIYETATPFGALKRISACITSGTYQSVHNNRIRWRSIVKDVRFAMIRR